MNDHEDPLDFIAFNDVTNHGDPSQWSPKGPKPGSPTPATSPNANPGTMKHYDLYDDEYGNPIEVHYFRNSDGSLDNVKVVD